MGCLPFVRHVSRVRAHAFPEFVTSTRNGWSMSRGHSVQLRAEVGQEVVRGSAHFRTVCSLAVQVAYLLVYGHLPTPPELARWEEAVMRHSSIPTTVQNVSLGLEGVIESAMSLHSLFNYTLACISTRQTAQTHRMHSTVRIFRWDCHAAS